MEPQLCNFVTFYYTAQSEYELVVSLIEFVSAHSYRFDNEMAIRQSVEADIAGLKKLIDDTNMSRMNIESEIEAVREELVFLRKNHENVS